MAFDGTEGGAISLTLAANLTAEYRRQQPNQTKAHFFGKNIIQSILDQNDCMGIRLYYGLDDDGNKQIVMVGADSDENDILDLVADLSHPCPNTCSKPNPLNS